MDTTQNRINAAMKEIPVALQETKESLIEAGKQVSACATKVVGELGPISRSAYNDVKEKGKEGFSYVENYIRKYPVRSMFFGAALGVVASRLLKRS